MSREVNSASASRSSCLRSLKAELERLKRSTGLGLQLELYWRPDESSDRHGEVKGNRIIIYDLEEEEAIRTLRHEFWDYYITKEIVEPLIQYVNMQKRVIERLIYERKERLIRGLNKLYSEDSSRSK